MIPASLAIQIASLRWMRKSIKDFIEADKLRILLNDCGWQIHDKKDGFTLIPEYLNSNAPVAQ